MDRARTATRIRTATRTRTATPTSRHRLLHHRLLATATPTVEAMDRARTATRILTATRTRTATPTSRHRLQHHRLLATATPTVEAVDRARTATRIRTATRTRTATPTSRHRLLHHHQLVAMLTVAKPTMVQRNLKLAVRCHRLQISDRLPRKCKRLWPNSDLEAVIARTVHEWDEKGPCERCECMDPECAVSACRLVRT